MEISSNKTVIDNNTIQKQNLINQHKFNKKWNISLTLKLSSDLNEKINPVSTFPIYFPDERELAQNLLTVSQLILLYPKYRNVLT